MDGHNQSLEEALQPVSSSRESLQGMHQKGGNPQRPGGNGRSELKSESDQDLKIEGTS